MKERIIEYNGKAQNLNEWSRETGINACTLKVRLNAGWSVEKALTTPPNRKTPVPVKSGQAEEMKKEVDNMGYFGDNRNSSGYLDQTAYLGLSGQNARPGEIWASRRNEDEEFLIIKNHGDFCTTLKLNDESKFNCMKINSRAAKYTNPAMLGYAFNNSLGEYIKKLPDIEFAAVLKAIEKALSLTVVEVFADQDTAAKNDEEVEKFASECVALRMELEDITKAYHASVEKLNNCTNTVLALENQLSAEQKDAEKFKFNFEMLREMYSELLEKFLARGVD